MVLEYESCRHLVSDKIRTPGIFLLLNSRHHFFLITFMNVTLGEKALGTNHFGSLMLLNKSKHIPSSPTFMEANLALRTGIDHATQRALVWQLRGQRCSDFPFLSLLPPSAGCEAVP